MRKITYSPVPAFPFLLAAKPVASWILTKLGSLIPVSLLPCPHAPQTAPLSAFTAELGLFYDGLASARRGATVGLTAASSIFPFSIGIASETGKLTRFCSENNLPTSLYDLFMLQCASRKIILEKATHLISQLFVSFSLVTRCAPASSALHACTAICPIFLLYRNR